MSHQIVRIRQYAPAGDGPRRALASLAGLPTVAYAWVCSCGSVGPRELRRQAAIRAGMDHARGLQTGPVDADK